MDYKFNLNLLIVCLSITSVLSANEDVQLNTRYVVRQHFGGERTINTSPLQVGQVVLLNNQNDNLNPGLHRNGRAQKFIQYQPAASYQVLEVPNGGKNTAGTTIQFPLTSTTTTYRFSNGQQQNVQNNVDGDLLRLLEFVENGVKKNAFTQLNSVQNVTPKVIKIPAELQYQPAKESQISNQPRYGTIVQNQYQNQPQVNYHPQILSQNSNQQQYQIPTQNQIPQKQFQIPSSFVYPDNLGTQNQLPNRYGIKNDNSEINSSLDTKIDDDKIGKQALASILGPG